MRSIPSLSAYGGLSPRVRGGGADNISYAYLRLGAA